MMNHYKLVAPDVDRLLSCFESGLRNPSVPSSDVASAMNPLFAKLNESCKAHQGLWNPEAEKILFEHFGVEI